MSTSTSLRTIEIRPNSPPQERFLSSPADIAIYGGAAGGGKTFALLLEPLRHIDVNLFGSVIFRRTSPQIRMEGGLWEVSVPLYQMMGGQAREQMLDWRWPHKRSRISFAALDHDRDLKNYDGAQIALIGFDQLEAFTYHQFFYMLSRNRTTCGIRPYIRATCNPDPDSWLADFLSWWIDQDTGYAIDERSGVIRYFVRIEDELHWAPVPGPLEEEFGDLLVNPVTGKREPPKSVTFVPAKVTDNIDLMTSNPGYLVNLRSLPRVERERLERGNWKIRPAAGMYFQREWFEVVDAVPVGARAVRGWDLAATEAKPGTDPDWTVGVKMSRDPAGWFYIEDVRRLRGTPHRVEDAVFNTASADGRQVEIAMRQDPGQAGKAQAQRYVSKLAGHTVRSSVETGDKVTRAGGLSAQAEAGNVKVVRGPWNDAFFGELENFPEGHDDQVDAAVTAFEKLVGGGAGPRVRAL